MLSNLTIRPVVPQDLDDLLHLSRETFTQAFAAQNTPANMAFYMDRAFTAAQLEQELADPNAIFFFACCDERPVGYAKLRTNQPQPLLNGYRHVELQRLYVLGEWKGKGVGQLLMQTCLRTATEQGYEYIWLGVWEQNLSAIAFYQRWGFERMGEHIFPFGDEDQTDWLMQRRIQNP